jgi:hypothetical protein
VSFTDAIWDRWDRQPGESGPAYHLFCHYRDLGSGRSLLKAVNEHRQRCLSKPPLKSWRSVSGTVHRWSSEWDWGERATGSDAELERQERAAEVKGRVAARRRHAQALTAALLSVQAPIAIVDECAGRPEDDRGAEGRCAVRPAARP